MGHANNVLQHTSAVADVAAQVTRMIDVNDEPHCADVRRLAVDTRSGDDFMRTAPRFVAVTQL